MNDKLAILRRLETELRRIRQLIDNEENSAQKAKMISAFSKLSLALTGNEL